VLQGTPKFFVVYYRIGMDAKRRKHTWRNHQNKNRRMFLPSWKNTDKKWLHTSSNKQSLRGE
jgi:hypothetical protein